MGALGCTAAPGPGLPSLQAHPMLADGTISVCAHTPVRGRDKLETSASAREGQLASVTPPGELPTRSPGRNVWSRSCLGLRVRPRPCDSELAEASCC